VITLTLAAGLVVGWAACRFAQPPSSAGHGPKPELASWSLFAESRRSVERHDVVEFCEGVARALRSSSSFGAAVWAGSERTDGVLGRELARARDRVDAGQDIDEALLAVAQRVGDTELNRVIDAIALCRPTGGPTAAVFDVMADAARQERDLTAALTALAAPARTSAMVVAALPLAFLVLAMMVDPGVVASLVSWPVGIVCLVSGAIAEFVGFAWMRRIVAGA
jgi:tight adherence protein B